MKRFTLDFLLFIVRLEIFNEVDKMAIDKKSDIVSPK